VNDPYIVAAKLLLCAAVILVVYLFACGLNALGEWIGRTFLPERRRPVLEPEHLEDSP
jgi:hypothetical protein